MKKDRSNSADSASGKDFSLPRSSVLKGRTNVQRLFTDQATVFRTSYVDLRFRVYSREQSECQMGFIVKKKLGPANQRNRVKRLLREAYRLNQHLLTGPVSESSVVFHGALMAKTINIDFNRATKAVTTLLERCRDHITSLDRPAP